MSITAPVSPVRPPPPLFLPSIALPVFLKLSVSGPRLSPFAPQRLPPFSCRARASEPFAPSLLHYSALSFLSLGPSLRGGLPWVLITQQVNLHHAVLCVLSLAHGHQHTGVRCQQPPSLYFRIKADECGLC